MELIISWVESASVAVGLKPWALTVFLIVLTSLSLDFIQRRVMKHLGQVAAKTTNLWDDALHHAVSRPLTLIIWLIGITMAAQAIPVEGEGQILDPSLIIKLRQIGVLFAIAWFLATFVKNIEKNMIENARQDERKIDQTTVNALGRVVRITIVVTVILIALDTLGVNVSGLLAAGGIGGLAIGLAAKDMLANFFGGITVFIDRPFSVGDWIVLKDKGIEGVV
ncbi:MAG: mechanosensitive ion channel domain-containing protein, partial [Xanthomonadales bacterium]